MEPFGLWPAEMFGPFPLAGLMRWGVALSPLVREWEQRAWEKRTVSIAAYVLCMNMFHWWLSEIILTLAVFLIMPSMYV